MCGGISQRRRLLSGTLVKICTGDLEEYGYEHYRRLLKSCTKGA